MARNRKELVYLRKRLRRNGTIALFLDVCRNGKRVNEYLKLYLVPELTREDKKRNQETLRIAEARRAKRIVELQAKEFGVNVEETDRVKFFDVMRGIIERKEGSTKESWNNCLARAKLYERNENITFDEITPRWVRGFRDYLDREAMRHDICARKRAGAELKPLSQGSKNLMFQKFCGVFHVAMREGIIQVDPSASVERFKKSQSVREFLTLEELRKLRKVPAPNAVLCRAFFFSCLTGLRWSDIAKLTWREVQQIGSGKRLVFSQRKTRTLEYLDINAQAVDLLGERGAPDSLVFEGLCTAASAHNNIEPWVHSAGIEKHITFHCARHTFAVMMLDLGVDLYTVSKLLGHKSIETTQIYAKILDKNKKAAVDRIPDILGG